MVTREYLDNYRHVPRIIKEGFFRTRRVVLVLQQQYHDRGTYTSLADPLGGPLDIDRKGWEDCEIIPEGGIKCGKN